MGLQAQTAEKLAEGFGSHASFEAEHQQRGHDQADEPGAACLGFPKRRLRVAISALYCLKVSMYAAFGKPGAIRQAPNALFVSDCVEMYQNGQDENVAFFWHQICCGTRLGVSEALATARDTKKTAPKAIFSLWMPRRKSPIFKLPVLIQFQVTADTVCRVH